jgi:hypothetical protein
MEEYKIKLKSHLYGLWMILFFGIVLIILYYNRYNLGKAGDALYVLYYLYAVQSIGLLLVHWNFYRCNRNDVLLVDSTNHQYSFSHNGVTTEFRNEDINKAIFYCSYPKYVKYGKRLLFWDDYDYIKIELSNGTIIVVTSLLTKYDIQFVFRGIDFETKRLFFRWIM